MYWTIIYSILDKQKSHYYYYYNHSQGRNQEFLAEVPDHCAKNCLYKLYRNIFSECGGGQSPGSMLVTALIIVIEIRLCFSKAVYSTNRYVPIIATVTEVPAIRDNTVNKKICALFT